MAMEGFRKCRFHELRLDNSPQLQGFRERQDAAVVADRFQSKPNMPVDSLRQEDLPGGHG